jgi:hypothetical protein
MIPNESFARRHGYPTVDRVRLASTTTRVPPAGRLLWGRGVLALMALAIFFWWSSLAGTPVAVAGMSGVARSATEPATERFVARTTVWLRGGGGGEASGLVEWTRQDEDGLRRYDLSASPNSARVAPGRRVEDFTAPTPWRLGLRDGRVEIATGPVEPFAGLLEQVSDQLGSPNRMSQKSNVYGPYEQVGLTPASLSAPLLRGGEDDRLDYAMVRKTLDESAIEEKIGADLAGSLGTLEVVRAVALPFRADIGFGKVLVGYQQLLLVRRAETGRMLMAVSSFGLSEPAGKETDPKSDEAALEEIYKGDVLRVQRVLLADGRDESDQRMLGAVPVAVEDFMAPIPLEPAGGSSSGSEVPDWAALGMYLASSMDVAGLSVAESGLNPLAATASPEVGMWTSALLRAGGGAAYVESLERLPEQPEVPSSVQPWSDAVLTQTAKASVAGASVGAIGGVAGLLASRATDSGLTLSIPSAPAPGAVAGAGASAGLQASVLLTAVVAEVATVAIVAAVATPAVVGAAGGTAAATAGLTTTQIALIGGGAVAVGGIAAAAGGGGGDDGGGGDPSPPPPPPPPPLLTPPNATGGLDNVGMLETFNVEIVFQDSSTVGDNDRISVFLRTILNDGSFTPWVATSLTNVNLNTPQTLFIPSAICCNEPSSTNSGGRAGVQVRIRADSPGDSGPATVLVGIEPADRVTADAARNLRDRPVQQTDLDLNEEAVFAVMYVP